MSILTTQSYLSWLTSPFGVVPVTCLDKLDRVPRPFSRVRQQEANKLPRFVNHAEDGVEGKGRAHIQVSLSGPFGDGGGGVAGVNISPCLEFPSEFYVARRRNELSTCSIDAR